jgi:ubiquinone/menaquinone biosynthesis C-methylase UbiE
MADRDSFQPLAFNAETDVPLAVFAGQMWAYALSVLYPARALKALGLYPHNSIGQYPSKVPSQGEGQFYCQRYREAVYLAVDSGENDSVREFDRTAGIYETIVSPVTQPVHEEALKLIRRFVVPAARILDLSCGPGTELMRLAPLVPSGEVVAVDLSAGMVATALANARRRGFHNTAFFQADVTNLPEHFSGAFDVVHCSFAFHHYSNPVAALLEMHRVLNPDGKVFVIDPGTWWLNLLSSPFAKWADPGWVTFRTAEEFRALFRQAGFSGFYWEEVLPGIGLCAGSK